MVFYVETSLWLCLFVWRKAASPCTRAGAGAEEELVAVQALLLGRGEVALCLLAMPACRRLESCSGCVLRGLVGSHSFYGFLTKALMGSDDKLFFPGGTCRKFLLWLLLTYYLFSWHLQESLKFFSCFLLVTWCPHRKELFCSLLHTLPWSHATRKLLFLQSLEQWMHS